MGFFRTNETHESRSSSMSYVLRWSYQNARRIAIFAILAIAVMSSFFAYIYTQGKKSIHLIVDGRPVAVQTKQEKVEGLIREQDIKLASEDQITPAIGNDLKDGDEVVIVHASSVQLIADGANNTRFTTADTVEDALYDLGIALSDQDKVYPPLDSKITPDMKIHVVRVNTVRVEQPQTVPYSVVKTADATLEAGKTKKVQPGSNGQVVHTVEKVFQDGQMISKRWIGKSVVKQATPEVIAVGTKKVVEEAPKTKVLAASIKRTSNSVNLGGISFKYKKVLKNVTMTAYSAEEEGIGTKTASGTRVKAGRTIAVDSSIIPLGWWVYIEGLGFRKAEDTGGAIKGNKIDVYYNTIKEANNFGRKSGRTVYVIGPVKPELN